MNDPVTSPAHYTAHPIEVIHLSRRLGAHLSQIVQYVMRAHLKGAELQDLRKALFWADDLLAAMEIEPVALACMAEPDFRSAEFTRQMSDERGRIVYAAWLAAWRRDAPASWRCLKIMRRIIAAEIALMEGEE